MTAHSPIGGLIAGERRRRHGDLRVAAMAAAVAGAAATLLLGLSGWFLAGAAIAGAGGVAAIGAFNYLLPSAGLRAMAILRTGGRYAERLFAHRAAFHALAAIRPALFAGLAASPPRKSLALSSGEAAAGLVQDVDAIETAFVHRSAPWAAGATAAMAAALIGLAAPLAAAAFLVGLAAQVAAGMWLGDRLTRAAGAAQLRAAGRLKDGLGAYLAAATELRSFGLTGRAIEALMAHDAVVGAAVVGRRDAEASLGLMQAGLAMATLVAVALLAQAAPLPLAALAMLSALAGMEGVSGLLASAQQRGAFREAVARLDAVLIDPGPVTPAPSGPVSLTILGRRLPPGSRLAISGPSGCGKTQLLEALVGLRGSPPGNLLIGSTPLEAGAAGWARGLFAFAPQDARLLTGTIAENLRLAAPDADETALWEALADAQLDARVARTREGLQTWIGDGGEVLSGGERRRLSLARAFLRPAPWLLLDEPTEGLDRGTEVELVTALERRLARTGQGVVIVSHRPLPLTLCTERIRMSPT